MNKQNINKLKLFLMGLKIDSLKTVQYLNELIPLI